jgi:hypothetical protein
MPFAVFNNEPIAPIAALERGRAYSLGANWRASAAFTGDIFALKNGTLWTIRLCLEMTLGFDATTPIATSQSLRIRRFTGSAAALASTVADVRVSDGTAALTAPGAIVVQDMRTIFAARSNATVVVMPETVFDVPPGEGITIQAAAASVIGDTASFNLSWYEV